MNNLLKKIYDEVLVYEKDVIEASGRIDDEIRSLSDIYKEQLTDKQTEELKDLLASVAFMAEEVGFEVGAKFMIKLLLSLLAD